LKVKVQYFAAVRELLNLREEIVDVADGTTVKGLFDLLFARHGKGLEEYVFDSKTGSPKPHLQFLLGEKSISSINGSLTVLTDGCVFAIIPPVGGG
jgi:molybdopterin converting factor small subunit